MAANVNGYSIKVFVWDSIMGQIPYSQEVCFPDDNGERKHGKKHRKNGKVK